MSNNQDITQLREVIEILQETLFKVDAKNKIQKDLFAQYIRIFHKLSQKLALLSNKINEQILIDESVQNENVGNIFQHLSNSLLRMADCSRNVAIKAKNQIFDPMKLFYDNYNNLNNQQLRKLKTLQNELHQKMSQTIRNRDQYFSASDKLERHRKGQNKIMTKIQNGDITQLQKFNNNIKRITQNIKTTEQNYKNSIQLINLGYQSMKGQLESAITSLTYNEESRISFSKKSVVGSIRILQDFANFYDKGVQKKIQDSSKMAESDKTGLYFHKNFQVKMKLLAASTSKQDFTSYEEIIKMKRKKSMEQDNNHLTQIFNQIRSADKQIISGIISPWFNQESAESPNKKSPDYLIIDEVKGKIMEFQPYSYYFIEQVYQQVNDMSSFYLKLNEENFLFLLNTFQTITNNLQFQSQTNSALIATQFLYKMAQISTRIIWLKNSINKNQPIDLLCHYYGKKTSKLSHQNVLKKLFLFIQKKKSIKKQLINQEENKGIINSFTKGFYGVMNRKKQIPLNDQQIFVCLQELTHIMANLLVPTDVSIPFLKGLLGKNQNSRSFEYLKSILFEKKDRQQRQKIFYRTEIKQRIERKMKQAIQNKRVSQFCLLIVAKRGFFSKKQLHLRLVCKQLQGIHKEILIRLDDLRSQEKWINLIPFNRKMNYIQMKQQVAENSVPSSIQEIITLDVNRSLHNHGQYLNPTILHSLLRTYAYFHKDISYCQGMNYIAGYLYIKTRDEESAYRIFEELMETRFKQLFANEFEVLKIKMYQFDRLLAIFFPEISDHFKKQAITPECYIVSWIITLFASSYQYTMESYLIDTLWERFIVWGWAQFFRLVLALFNNFKEQLLELTYDRALHFLGEMGRSQMFLSSKQKFLIKYVDKDIQKSLDEFPISEDMLQNLRKQYKLN